MEISCTLYGVLNNFFHFYIDCLPSVKIGGIFRLLSWLRPMKTAVRLGAISPITG